ncbi:RnfABCDGE type electron transport complex subunit B [Rhodovulum tesquicola]|uniref:RnfABCDGE type electron transport complex subunit B n=1 Tax=Rhodovulum tesquicola TaxID=540254 RepID=UPI002097DDED|nr:RnfABCDGE type electron transport complex subunit B [Rhodovulum tesquicola]MCO8144596.1 RnfABCDGE type electron transport complex subunit B [Rhodovulum tesquicola]
MLSAVASMSAMGLGLGLLLGLAARKFHVETPPIVDEIERLLPGTNCGQCGFPGCRAGAEALVEGTAPVSLCPPGGRELAMELVQITGADLDAGGARDAREDVPQMVAFIFEDHCTGCTKCFKRCPTDAIVGANRQIHTVITDACIGCDACIEVCPTEAIILRPKPRTMRNWYWDKPDPEADGGDLDMRRSA